VEVVNSHSLGGNLPTTIRRMFMINFDEEIQKFQPSLEIEQAEDVINNNDLTDITDILKELLKGNKEK
jgi:hypothetical protein